MEIREIKGKVKEKTVLIKAINPEEFRKGKVIIPSTASTNDISKYYNEHVYQGDVVISNSNVASVGDKVALSSPADVCGSFFVYAGEVYYSIPEGYIIFIYDKD